MGSFHVSPARARIAGRVPGAAQECRRAGGLQQECAQPGEGQERLGYVVAVAETYAAAGGGLVGDVVR